jgi:hypothetical protein
VAGIAQGSPWLAHTACLIAAKQGIFRWSDTAELLTQLVEQRLRQAGSGSDEHRAAAVALALLTTAGEGRDLAALAGAVTVLPHDPARLEVLLEDLVQAGITGGPPYLISPAAAGPVLVAAALDPGARVKVRLGPALRALGRGAMPVPGGQPSPGEHGVLGIGPLPRADDDRAGVFDAGRLAGQLSVLAQAARQREVPRMLGTLQEAVLELLPGEADIATWLDVLTVAAPVAAAAPQLAGHLRDTLTRGWPPGAVASLWDDDPVRQYRLDIETLLNRPLPSESRPVTATSTGRSAGCSSARGCLSRCSEPRAPALPTRRYGHFSGPGSGRPHRRGMTSSREEGRCSTRCCGEAGTGAPAPRPGCQ